MSDKKTLFLYLSVGITLLLLILLILPIAIWSPPWNDNGYYRTENIPDWFCKTYGINKSQVHQLSKEQFYMFMMVHKLADKRFDQELYDDVIHNKNKVMNPFTLWSIKFKEWIHRK